MKKIILALIFIFYVSLPCFAATTTTITVASDADDGTALKESSSAYPPNTTAAYYGEQNYFGGSKSYSGQYDVQCGVIRFNTSSLPDSAIITSAKLRLYCESRTSSDSRSLNGEYRTNSFNDSDYTTSVGTTAFSKSITTFATSQYNEIDLSNLTSISKTGYTGFRFGVSGDTTPTGINLVQFHTYHYYTGTSRPQLEITYTTGYAHEINGVANSPEVNGVANPAEVNGL